MRSQQLLVKLADLGIIWHTAPTWVDACQGVVSSGSESTGADDHGPAEGQGPAARGVAVSVRTAEDLLLALGCSSVSVSTLGCRHQDHQRRI